MIFKEKLSTFEAELGQVQLLLICDAECAQLFLRINNTTANSGTTTIIITAAAPMAG